MIGETAETALKRAIGNCHYRKLQLADTIYNWGAVNCASVRMLVFDALFVVVSQLNQFTRKN